MGKKNPQKEEKGLAVSETPKPVVHQGPTPEDLISQAIAQNVPVETLDKLFELQTKVKAAQAKEAYDEDMANLQGELPVIEKKKSAKNDSGKVLYSYAPLDDIITQVGPIISKHGFSYSFKVNNSGDKVNVTCIIKHRLGHAEESSMETTLATKTGIMSGPQQIAATVTFNKRYAFCNAFGIATGDEDKEEAVMDVEERKKFVNYINKLQTALKSQGAKNLDQAIEIYNRITGESVSTLPANNKIAEELYNKLANSPMYKHPDENL